MATITLEYNGRNSFAQKLIDTVLASKLFAVVEPQKPARQHAAKKKTGLDEALDDLKNGRVSRAYSSVDELFESLEA